MNNLEWIEYDLPVAAAVIRGGNAWSIEQMNREFCRLFGLEGNLADANEIKNFFSEKDTGRIGGMLEQALRNGASDLELCIEKKTDRAVGLWSGADFFGMRMLSRTCWLCFGILISKSTQSRNAPFCNRNTR